MMLCFLTSLSSALVPCERVNPGDSTLVHYARNEIQLLQRS